MQSRLHTPPMLTGQRASEPQTVALKWTHELAPDQSKSLAMGTELSVPTFDAAGAILFIGSRQTGLFAFHTASGSLLWVQKLDGGVVGTPAVTSDLVFVGTGSGQLVAVKRDTGAVVWQASLKGLAKTKPIVFGNEVIVRDGTNTVYAFDQATGEWRWQVSREKPEKFSSAGESPLFIASGNIYVGMSDGTVLCLDASANGKLLWELSLGGETEGFKDVDANFIFYRQYLSASSVSTGIALIDTRKGRVKTRFARPLIVTQAGIDTHLLLGDGNGEIYRLDPERNEVIWRSRFSRNHGSPQTMIVIDRLVFVTFPRGGLVALYADTGQTAFGIDIGYGLTGLAVHEATRQLALMTDRGTLMLLAPSQQPTNLQNSPFTPLTR
jgi:outer membrane protein assembly factor BamB